MCCKGILFPANSNLNKTQHFFFLPNWQLLFLLPLYANALLFPLFIPRLPIKHTTLISLFYFSQEKEKRNSPSNYLIKHTFLFFFPQFNSLSKKVHNFTFHITFLEKHSPFMPLNLRQFVQTKNTLSINLSRKLHRNNSATVSVIRNIEISLLFVHCTTKSHPTYF